MFTGIISYRGILGASEVCGGDRRLRVRSRALIGEGIAIGDSIAVNGVCLTAAGLLADAFEADVSLETLQLTTLGELETGAPLNLEPALALGDRLGGHFVSGHVDGKGTVRSVRRDARSLRIEVEVPQELVRYLPRKGSISVDGVSLTINSVSDTAVGLNIIPHTADATTIGHYRAGTRVNIEVDMLARYLESLTGGGSGINEHLPQAHGYA
jgi:riboflavin synthase